MSEITAVGIADIGVAKNPGRLVTVGLGSCVGVVLQDTVAKIGALAHIMLPSSENAKIKNKAKFADTAIPLAVEKMEELGAQKSRIVAKIAGGARMFSFPSEQSFIGDRNVAAVEEVLKKNGIKIAARDIGGNMGRTLELDVSSGKVVVKTIAKGTTEI